MARLCRNMLHPGSRVLLICSAFQFGPWHMVCWKKEDWGTRWFWSVRGWFRLWWTEKIWSCIRSRINSSALHPFYGYVPPPGASLIRMLQRKPFISGAQTRPEKVFWRLSIQGHKDVPITYQCWTDWMKHISRVPVDVNIMVTYGRGSKRCWAIHPKHKCEVWMRHGIYNPTTPEQIVTYPCVAVFSTFKACMLLPKHQPLLNVMYTRWFNASGLSVIEVWVQ